MKLECPVSILFLALFLPTTYMQAQDHTPKMGVVVQSMDRKSDKSTTVHLLNISDKEVTAFNLSVKQKLSHGNTRTTYAYTREMLEGYMIAAKALSPNCTFDVDIPGEYLHHPTLVVDVVIYADGTAQVQNRDRFKDIMDQRAAQLRTLEKVDDAIEKVLADPAAKDRTASVVMRLKAMLADYPMLAPCMDDCVTPEQRMLESQIHDLTPFLSRNQEAPLNEILERNKSQIAQRRLHAQVTEIPSAALPRKGNCETHSC
jgi:hypothetical protein